jgi:hypothetical protein
MSFSETRAANDTPDEAKEVWLHDMSANGGQQVRDEKSTFIPVIPSWSCSTRHAVSCQLLCIKPILTIEPYCLQYMYTCGASMRKNENGTPPH